MTLRPTTCAQKTSHIITPQEQLHRVLNAIARHLEARTYPQKDELERWYRRLTECLSEDWQGK